MTLFPGMDMWIALGVMCLITLLLRALPLLIHRSVLQQPSISRLNQELPLCVMVVLVMHSLGGGAAISAAALLPQVAALATVALTYLRWRNALLSVVIGIGVLTLLGGSA